jgi:hypothetical protein
LSEQFPRLIIVPQKVEKLGLGKSGCFCMVVMFSLQGNGAPSTVMGSQRKGGEEVQKVFLLRISQ